MRSDGNRHRRRHASAHTRLIPALNAGGDSGQKTGLFQSEVTLVAKEVIPGGVVGHKEVDAAIAVEVGADDRQQAVPFRFGTARLS